MKIATALMTGDDALPQLAAAALEQALAKAGLKQASSVLLFLTPDFARQAAQAVTAVARAAQCTQVTGGIAAGVLTEDGWSLERPAAAVMVFGESVKPAAGALMAPLLSYGAGIFPAEWRVDAARFGATLADGFLPGNPPRQTLVWQNGRISENGRCSLELPAGGAEVGVSTGLQRLGQAACVEASEGFDLRTIGGESALAHLRGALSTTLPQYAGDERRNSIRRERAADLLRFSAIVADRPVAIVAINADDSITLAEHIAPGECLGWALREAETAAAEMRQSVDRLAEKVPNPACALMFSCIGRGPYFYGGADRDLDALRERLPGLPIIGAYATGQIAPIGDAGRHQNSELHNSVVMALLGKRRSKS